MAEIQHWVEMGFETNLFANDCSSDTLLVFERVILLYQSVESKF